jgi:hypothetical protein
MRRRHESSRKYESAAAVLWLLLPLLVLVALNTNFLPQLARCKLMIFSQIPSNFSITIVISHHFHFAFSVMSSFKNRHTRAAYHSCLCGFKSY